MRPIFEDTATAFSIKSDTELERAYFLFKLIATAPLVKIGTVVTNFALKAKLPVEGLIRATVFDHFCGGITEQDCEPIMDKMQEKNVFSVLDYSVEGKSNEVYFDSVTKKIKNLIVFSKAKTAIPFVVFKPTAIGDITLYEKIGRNATLSDLELASWQRVKARMFTICEFAHAQQIPVLIDGEESWMQDAADALVCEMMQQFNKEKVIVYNTLQAYRWDRLPYLKALNKKAKSEGFMIGIKVVRGAYMEKERLRAKEKGYKSPICENKIATDDNFNAVTLYILDHLNTFSIYLGTHNEKSTYLLMEKMQEKKLANNNSNIWFGQLFGMSDHISYNLGAAGYNVSKYLPFGPVKDVMPYLMRRAEENTSVAGQTNRELDLLAKERKRRKI